MKNCSEMSEFTPYLRSSFRSKFLVTLTNVVSTVVGECRVPDVIEWQRRGPDGEGVEKGMKEIMVKVVGDLEGDNLGGGLLWKSEEERMVLQCNGESNTHF